MGFNYRDLKTVTGDRINENDKLLVKEFRDKLLFHNDKDLFLGKLVLDLRDGELGFIVGPFEKKDAFGSIDTDRCLLVTLDKDTGGFRVRYPKKRDVRIIPEDDSFDSIKPTCQQDLNTFCNELCIMDCSELCTLYKYKKKNK